MTLDLCRLPKPVRNASKVMIPSKLDSSVVTTDDGLTTSILVEPSGCQEPRPVVNLFQVKRVSGYFPFTRVVDGVTELAVSNIKIIIIKS